VEFYAFRLCCQLPAKVTLRGSEWTIAISYDGKGRRASLDATNGSKRGSFLVGRTRDVETAIFKHILAPVGTIRHQLALQLVSEGRAVRSPD
jgi:hypothetical protein